MRQYLLITASYWAFTLTDGALRMLVVLHFHQLGYSPLDIAFLFLFYEFFGVLTNLFGGWLAARLGLATTLLAGLFLQVGALGMLLVDDVQLTVAWVMLAQALSGVAKDLNKMSAKSGVKLVAGDGEQRLYRWIAALTGSKNALKGVGFFLGGLLLTLLGFWGAIATMAAVLSVVALVALLLLDRDVGKASFKPKFTDLLSKSAKVNRLSAARFFLFGGFACISAGLAGLVERCCRHVAGNVDYRLRYCADPCARHYRCLKRQATGRIHSRLVGVSVSRYPCASCCHLGFFGAGWVGCRDRFDRFCHCLCS